MMNLCLRYTRNEADAMEVLNTGFYKVYKNIHRYNDSMAGIYTWIRSIIINSCLDFIQSRQTLSVTGDLEQAAQAEVSPVAISALSAADILKLVRQLPPATQAVFNLYAIEGYTHGEIAALMKISEGTSKWHLSEARKKMQKLISESDIK